MATVGRRMREWATRNRVNMEGLVPGVEQARRMVKAREIIDEETEGNKTRRKFNKVMDQLKRGVPNQEGSKYRYWTFFVLRQPTRCLMESSSNESKKRRKTTSTLVSPWNLRIWDASGLMHAPNSQRTSQNKPNS